MSTHSANFFSSMSLRHADSIVRKVARHLCIKSNRHRKLSERRSADNVFPGPELFPISAAMNPYDVGADVPNPRPTEVFHPKKSPHGMSRMVRTPIPEQRGSFSRIRPCCRIGILAPEHVSGYPHAFCPIILLNTFRAAAYSTVLLLPANTFFHKAVQGRKTRFTSL